METMDHVEHAMTVEVVEGEESSKHGNTYPGVYLCRFEQQTLID